MVNLVQGDYGSDLTLTLTEAAGSALNLTSNTGITFQMVNKTGVFKKVSGAGTTVTAASGICKYTTVDGDTDTVGTYEYEVQVTYTGKVVTAKGAETIIILEEHD